MNDTTAKAAGFSEFRRGWPVVLASMFGIGLGLSPVPFYTIGMLAPELNKAFGWEFGAIMIGLMIMTLGVLVASTVVGHLGDRFGVRRVALISVVLFALSFMAFSFSNGSIVLFYVNWAVMAVVGAGTLPVTWTRAVNNHFDARKGLALGLSLLGTGIFGFLIKPFTAWLIATYGWRTTYLVIGMLPLLLAWPIAYFAFHDVGERTDSSAERRKASAARLEVTPGLRLGQALKSWRYWVLAFAFVCVSFGVGGPIPNMENILKVAGFERDNIVSLVARYFGMKGYSAIYGSLYGFFALGAGIGPVVFGKVFDKTGSYAPVLGTSAALLMIGAVSLLFLGRYQRYEN